MVPEGATVLIEGGPSFNSDGTPWYHVNHAGKHGYLMGTFLVPTNAPAAAPSPARADRDNGHCPRPESAGCRER